jgi:hypothetical protein
MAKKYAPKTSKHFAGNPLYQRLVNIMHNVDNVSQASDKIGVSKSTLYRWLKYGIPSKSQNNQEYKQKITRVSAGYTAYRRRVPSEEQKEIRPFFYNRRHGGVITKYWNVENASILQMHEIILRECRTNKYSGFYFLLKFDEPFNGYWDGVSTEVYKSDGSGKLVDKDNRPLSASERKNARNLGSWVDVSADKPFLNTNIVSLNPYDCNPDILIDNLYQFYNMKHYDIVEIRFNERKSYDERVDIYSDDYE